MPSRAAIHLSKPAVRRYLLRKQGLLGPRRFVGQEGVYQYIRQAGSIQFDPIDVIARNPELVLQSRVEGYARPMLQSLLYEQRRLVDYFDKELCIFPTEDWPHFHRRRLRMAQIASTREGEEAMDAVVREITERGPLSSKELDMPGKVHWFWGPTRLARAALEQLYYAGRLGIHSKQGAIKRYDLVERLLPEELVTAPDPHEDEQSLQRFLLLRRAGALGLVWDKASPAYLGIPNFKTPERRATIQALVDSGDLLPLRVEGMKDTLFLRKEDEPLLQEQNEPPRTELLAPLDGLLWDRALIKQLFDFDYSWEIYTTPAKRKYGYYVLPLLHGDKLVGRVEPVYLKKEKKLGVKGIWYEEGIKPDRALKKATDEALHRMEKFLKKG